MGNYEYCKAIIAMIGLQFVYAGVALITRPALLQGMNPRVFVAYRQGIATLVMAPLAYLSIRKKSYSFNLGSKCFGWIFLASFIGMTANQNAYFEGLYLTSSTAATALINLAPAITFVMASISGMEKVNVRSLRSIAKMVGTLICVGGAICMALLKGPKLLNSQLLLSTDYWLLGCLSLFGAASSWSLWMILQVPISRNCPDHLYSSAWMAFMGTIQSVLFVFCTEKDASVWRLTTYLQLGCCLFAGTGLGASFFIQSWCISRRGPLFSAMFTPLCVVVVAIIGTLFLHEETHLGSLIGAFGVITGIYVVLWGKAEDQTKDMNLQNEDSLPQKKENPPPDLEEPLLSNISSHLRKTNVTPSH